MSAADLWIDPRALWMFLLVTVCLGGGAAWLSGRAVARSWKSWWNVALAMLALACAVRFIHFSVFGSRLLSLQDYLVDLAVCLLFGLLGFRYTRVGQMAERYAWINVRTGPFTWRRRDHVQIADPDDSR